MNKIKKWLKETALPWLKKSWLQIVNILVVLGAYGALDTAEVTAAWWVGLWGFILLGYYIFWKLFGFDKVMQPIIKAKWDKFVVWLKNIFKKK